MGFNLGRALKGIGKGLFGGGGASGLFGTGKFNPSVDTYWRNQAKTLAGSLAERSQGKGTSVAEQTLKKGFGQNLAQTQSNIQSFGGVSPALKQRLSQQAGAKTGANIATEGGILRAQEQVAAQDSLSRLLSSMEGSALDEQKIKQRSFSDTGKARQKGLQGLGSAIASIG